MARKPRKPYPPPADYVKPPMEAGKVDPPKAPNAPPAGAPVPPKPGAPPPPEAHARASAAAGEPGAKPGAGKTEPPLGQSPEQAAAALVMLTEVGTSVACKFYAARLKIKMTPVMVAALKLTEEERANLMTYAPYAAPFLWEVLQKYGKYIGAALYGLVFYDALVTRFAALKELAPVKEKKGRKKKEETPEVVAPPAAPDVPKEGDDAKPAEGFKVIG